jgi:hypothetical protein
VLGEYLVTELGGGIKMTKMQKLVKDRKKREERMARERKLAELAEIDRALGKRILYLTCICKPYLLDEEYVELIEREKELKRELGIGKEGESK